MEAFRNYLDDCLQSFGENVSVVWLGDLNTSFGDMVGRHRVPGIN